MFSIISCPTSMIISFLVCFHNSLMYFLYYINKYKYVLLFFPFLKNT